MSQMETPSPPLLGDLPGALGELQQSSKLSSWNWMASQESSAQVLASDLPCRLSTPALGRNLLIPAPRTQWEAKVLLFCKP